MKSIPSVILATVSLALLSACGGDGGGDDSSKSAPTAVAVTTTNETAVARATIANGFAIADTQSSGSNIATTASAKTRALGALVRRAVSEAAARRSAVASATVHPAASTTDTEPCGVSGTLSTSFDDKDGNGSLTSGDVVTAVFSQCRDSSTLLMNGTLVITMTSVTSADQFAANAVLQGFDIVDVDLSSLIDGTISITESDTTAESDTTLAVGDAGLTVASSSTSYTDSVTFANGTRIAYRESTSDDQSSVTLDGSFSAASIDGSVTVATVQPIVQLAGDSYPSSGAMRVTGASNSALLLTVLSATQVQLQLDANGDGTYESTSDASWSTLIP